MARRGLTGQLNMFDLFNSLEEPGEVEMVSLVPEFEDELEPVGKPEPVVEQEDVEKSELVGEVKEIEEEPASQRESMVSEHLNREENVVMSRSYVRDGIRVEIAYLNYNKVRIQHGGEEPEIKVFATSKEAVDYYVEVMQEYEKDEE